MRIFFFKVFIECVTILLLFYVLDFCQSGQRDLSSLTRDWKHISCIGKKSPNHWSTREVSSSLLTPWIFWTSLVAQLVKNLPAMQETPLQFLGREDSRLPTPIFLGFPGGSDNKASTCNARDLGSIPGLGRSGGGHSAGKVILPSLYLFCQMPWLFGDGDRSLGETLQRTVCTGLGSYWSFYHRWPKVLN